MEALLLPILASFNRKKPTIGTLSLAPSTSSLGVITTVSSDGTNASSSLRQENKIKVVTNVTPATKNLNLFITYI